MEVVSGVEEIQANEGLVGDVGQGVFICFTTLRRVRVGGVGLGGRGGRKEEKMIPFSIAILLL